MCNNITKSLQGARFVEHDIIGEMKSQFFLGMLLPGLGRTTNS